MWNEADYSLSELVEMAVGCIDEDSEEWSISGAGNIQRFRSLMYMLMEKISIDPREYRISDQTFQKYLREFLNEIKHEEKPSEFFTENIGELEKKMGKKDLKQYKIGFPLNFKFHPIRKKDNFTPLGHKIERMKRNQWISSFKEVAEETEEENRRDDSFTDFMERIPNDFSGQNFTFWKFEMEARDEKFVVDRLEKILGYLLGKINVAAHVNQTEEVKFTRSVWPSSWSDLKHPFIYIVFENGSYSRFYYDEDISPRRRFKIHSNRKKRFDLSFKKFPEIEYPLDQLEESFAETVRRFQSAITESNRNDSFLEYWRGIEALTLAEKDDDMDTVIKRAEAPIKVSDQKFFRYRLKVAKNKRNNLVHEGVDVSVSKQNQNLLKIVLEVLIWIYCENLNDWNKEDFRFFLDKADQEEGVLENNRGKLHRKVELIDRILEEKRYEETVFEKIYLDWRSGSNELEAADFIDPFAFFFPVFGIGNENADIMVIADFPTYPLGEGTEIKKRSKVDGRSPNEFVWESMDNYRNWLTQLMEKSNPDGLWDVLEAVADSVDVDTDELYFTTFQKDGQFDESRDETKNGKDPVKLNHESVEKWKPYLEKEIDFIEPKLIIIFGEKTLSALGKIITSDDDFNVDSVPYGEFYVLDKYPILRFDYWTEIDLKESKSLRDYLKNRVNRAWASL